MKGMLVSSLVRGNKFASVRMLTLWKSKEVLRKFNTIRWSFWRCFSIDATEWQNFWSGWSQSLKTIDTIELILNGNNGNFILAFFSLNLISRPSKQRKSFWEKDWEFTRLVIIFSHSTRSVQKFKPLPKNCGAMCFITAGSGIPLQSPDIYKRNKSHNYLTGTCVSRNQKSEIISFIL